MANNDALTDAGKLADAAALLAKARGIVKSIHCSLPDIRIHDFLTLPKGFARRAGIIAVGAN